jgi:hypothetical protein
MRLRLAHVALAASIAVFAGSISVPKLAAQEKKAQLVDIQGTVVDILKDKSSISIRNGNSTRQVTFDSHTKFLYGHSKEAKPGSISDVKKSFYISCAIPSDSKDLLATECVYRETK